MSADEVNFKLCSRCEIFWNRPGCGADNDESRTPDMGCEGRGSCQSFGMLYTAPGRMRRSEHLEMQSLRIHILDLEREAFVGLRGETQQAGYGIRYRRERRSGSIRASDGHATWLD